MMCRGYDLEEGAESAEAEDGTVPEDSRIEKLEFELGTHPNLLQSHTHNLFRTITTFLVFLL